MKKFTTGVIILALICGFFQTNTAFAEAEGCSVDEDSGACYEGSECKLSTDEIGVCKQSSNGCTCVPIS